MSRLDIDIAACVKAIAKFKGNKSRAAEVLGIDPSTLYRKLSRYDAGSG